MYGSTEVAYATVADPADLAKAPSTVGRVLRGSVVRVVDEDGRDVPTGKTGRIFVGNRSSSRATPAAAPRTCSTG